MKYPCLVPKRLCKTPVHVHLESEELDNKGRPKYSLDADLMCNFQDKAKTILTAEAGADHWYSAFYGRHCTRYAVFKWRNSNGIW